MFFLWTSTIRGLRGVGSSSSPSSETYGRLCLSFTVSSGTYCNKLHSRSVCIKEVFLAGGFFLNGQRTSFASEESHPQRKLKCIKMMNRTVLGVVILVRAVDLASQTCTLPRLELAAGFVRVGIQRHLFGYPGAGPGSWKRLDCAIIIQLWFNIPMSPFQDLYFNLFRNICNWPRTLFFYLGCKQ